MQYLRTNTFLTFLLIAWLTLTYIFGIFHWIPLTIFTIGLSLKIYQYSRNPTLIVGLGLLFVGLLSGIQGFKNQYPQGVTWSNLLSEFYANISTEAISIAITVIIIDSLNRRRETVRGLKDKLITDLRSPNTHIVSRALVDLKKRKWLQDGSLQGAYLCGANFTGADLTSADMSGALLSGANFSESILQNAKLTKADFSGANLKNANFQDCKLMWANLSKCDFRDADFRGADLSGAIVPSESVAEVFSYEGAIMPNLDKFEIWIKKRKDSHITDIKVSLVDLKKQVAISGNLVGANLMNLNLSRMDMSNMDMKGANLVGANLSGAKLIGTNLNGANLEMAILNGADLESAILDRVNLWRASMVGVKNLSSVKSMNEANIFEIEIGRNERKIIKRYKTISKGNYSELFKYFLKKGISKDELREIFLWTAHSYPGDEI